ncbi:hypothetical protein CHLRE_09g398250v5 [Chlamydomonas reinhardtii]|uniref:Uncharacterized protein n=1 Tax=Chlamydomonas reinhardtii TaxID=3055 RepID=A0A2K3DD14_CHLRE|nr:uncharacterized protein CHLRE_09g398250v5 [Chlamydomonas reinhardtii]PNW78419.1 hypothetical protein CHLRE_09g398250v5 [Chlamydomonas reinhardtii]
MGNCQVSSTCTTSRACPLPGFSQDDTMRGTLYASCDASPCTAGLGSLRAGAPQDCNLPGTPAIIRCCTPRAKVRCAQQHACTWVAPRIMDLEIQRRTIIPGCRVKSFWGQLLASKAQTNTVLQSIVAMAPAVTRFLRSFPIVAKWYLERWDGAVQPVLDMIICGSKREQLTPEQTTAAAATASLLALPAAKDFLLSTTTGSILSEYLMEVKGFDTRDIDSFLTQDQLFTALDLLRAPGIHVDEGLDPAAAGLLGLPGGLGALVSELVAFDSRLTVRQMVRDVARLATTVLRTAVQGPPATADEAAYPEGFLPLLFGMTPEVRASFSMALSTLPALEVCLINTISAVEVFPKSFTRRPVPRMSMPPSPPPSPHPSPSAPPRPESPVDGSEDPAGTQPPSTPPASPPSFQDVYPPATGFADWCPTRSYVGRLVANPMGPRPIVQATLEVIPLLADIIEALPTTYNWYSSRWDKAAIPILEPAICGSLFNVYQIASEAYDTLVGATRALVLPALERFFGTQTGKTAARHLANVGFNVRDLETYLDSWDLSALTEFIAQSEDASSAFDSAPIGVIGALTAAVIGIADSSNGFKPFNVALDLMTFAHELFSAPTSSRTAQIAEADPNLTDLLTVSGTENAAITTLAARIQELKPLVYRMMRTGVDTAIELIEPYSEEDSTANYAYN